MARKREYFWLNDAIPAEDELRRDIENWKQKRQFHKTVTGGLRLMGDLQKHRTDELYKSFPWLEDLIEVQVRMRVAEELVKHSMDKKGSGSGEGGDLAAKIDRVEQLLIQQRAGVGNNLRLQELRPGESIHDTQRSYPIDPDDAAEAIDIVQAAINPEDILNNFMRSLGAAEAKPAIKKKEPKAKKQLPKVPVGLPHAAVLGSAKPLAGAGVQFAAPVFDD